jgi:predicted MFS family arabinose efflux permease
MRDSAWNVSCHTPGQKVKASSGESVNRRIFLLTLGNFTVGTGMYAFLGVLRELAGSLEVGVGEAGQLATAFAMTFAVAAPPMVASTRRLGARRVLVLSLLGFGAMNVIGAVAPSFTVLLGSRIGGALFACVFAPVAGAVATTMVSESQRGKALAAVVAGVVLSFAFGIPLGTIVGGVFGWRATFAFAAVCNVLGAVAIAAGIPQTSTPEKGLPSLSFLKRWSILSNLALVVAAFAGVFIAIGYVGPLIEGLTLLDETGVGLIQIVVGVGGAIGTIVGGLLADRRPTTGTLALLYAASAAGLVPFSLLWWGVEPGSVLSIVGVAGALFVGSTSVFAMVPILQFRVVREALDERETALAFYFASFFFGQGMGAALGGVFVEVFSLQSLGFGSAAVLLAGGLFAVVAVPDSA